MARPTDYSEEILEQTLRYLEEWDELGDAVPQIASLSRYLGVARSSVYKWAGEHKKFSDILEDILSEQERTLINKGLKNEYNSTITKLGLTKHGYSDKVAQDVTSKGEKIQQITGMIIKEDEGEDNNLLDKSE